MWFEVKTMMNNDIFFQGTRKICCFFFLIKNSIEVSLSLSLSLKNIREEIYPTTKTSRKSYSSGVNSKYINYFLEMKMLARRNVFIYK